MDLQGLQAQCSAAGSEPSTIATVCDVEFLRKCLRKAGLDEELITDVLDACELGDLNALSLGCNQLSPPEAAERLFLTQDEAKALLHVCRRQCLRAGVLFGDGEVYEAGEDDEWVPEPDPNAPPPVVETPPPSAAANGSAPALAQAEDSSDDEALSFSPKSRRTSDKDKLAQRDSLDYPSGTVEQAAEDADADSNPAPPLAVVGTLGSRLRESGPSTTQQQAPAEGTLASQLAARALLKQQQKLEQQRLKEQQLLQQQHEEQENQQAKKAVGKPGQQRKAGLSQINSLRQASSLTRAGSAKTTPVNKHLGSANATPRTNSMPTPSQGSTRAASARYTPTPAAVSAPATPKTPVPAQEAARPPAVPVQAGGPETPAESVQDQAETSAAPVLEQAETSVQEQGAEASAAPVQEQAETAPVQATEAPPAVGAPPAAQEEEAEASAAAAAAPQPQSLTDAAPHQGLTVTVPGTSTAAGSNPSPSSTTTASTRIPNTSRAGISPASGGVPLLAIPRPIGVSFSLTETPGHAELDAEAQAMLDSPHPLLDDEPHKYPARPSSTGLSKTPEHSLPHRSLSAKVSGIPSHHADATPHSARSAASSTHSASFRLPSARPTHPTASPRPQSAALPSTITASGSLPSYARATAAYTASVHTRIAEEAGADPAAATAAALGVRDHHQPTPFSPSAGGAGSGIPKRATPSRIPTTSQTSATLAALPKAAAGGEVEGKRPRRHMFAQISSSLLRPTKAFLAWAKNGKPEASASEPPQNKQFKARPLPKFMTSTSFRQSVDLSNLPSNAKPGTAWSSPSNPPQSSRVPQPGRASDSGCTTRASAPCTTKPLTPEASINSKAVNGSAANGVHVPVSKQVAAAVSHIPLSPHMNGSSTPMSTPPPAVSSMRSGIPRPPGVPA